MRCSLRTMPKRGQNGTKPDGSARRPGPQIGLDAWIALEAIVDRLGATAWRDEVQTERAVRAWTRRYSVPEPPDGNFADLAGALKAHGANPGRAAAGAVIYSSWQNLSEGRDVDERALLASVFGRAVPARTIRRYRANHGSDSAAAGALFERLQRQADIQCLMAGGRSRAAARKWLAEHSQPARTAPPPRRSPNR